MIIFTVYLLLISFLLWRNSFFGIFKDEVLNKNFISVVFILKSLAVPALYFLFLKLYGGIQGFDAGKFFFDAATLNQLALDDPQEYLKTLLGLQDETEGGHFYKVIIEPTFNWENGAEKDFFYNDNRVIIRLHSIIHFISFGSYFVHALVSCFFSFIGLFLFYKSFKEYLPGKERIFFMVICFFPSLWLYTGGLLKEGWCVFFLGANIYTIRSAFRNGFAWKRIIVLSALLWISMLLKPYILLFSFLSFTIYYAIEKFFPLKRKLFLYAGSMLILTGLMNLFVSTVKSKTLYEAALERQIRFADVAEGGIFLTDSSKLIRLKYDWKLVTKDPERRAYYFIKKDVPYTYWEHQHKLDTLYCTSNQNTTVSYSLAYVLPTGGSNLELKDKSAVIVLIRSFYHTTAYPFFINAKGPMQLLASAENLLMILSILICIYGIFFLKAPSYFPAVILFMGLVLFLLIGFTTPNSGAILRYRAPASLFLLTGALYYFRVLMLKWRSKT